MEKKKSSRGTVTGGGGVEDDESARRKANRKTRGEQEKREKEAANKGKQSQTGRPSSSSSSLAGSTDTGSGKRGGRVDNKIDIKENTKGSKQDGKKGGGSGPDEAETPPLPPGHIELKPFQRTPKQLLHNYCQKHKLPRPRFELRRAARPNYFRSECILTPSARDASQQMRFLTEQDWEFKSHSEHFSALLALHALEPTRPNEKVFPSPFKEAWLALSSPPIPAASPPSSQRGRHRASGAPLAAVAAAPQAAAASAAAVESASAGASVSASRKSTGAPRPDLNASASSSAALGSPAKQQQTGQVVVSRTGDTRTAIEQVRERGHGELTSGAHARTRVEKGAKLSAVSSAGATTDGKPEEAAETGSATPTTEAVATTAKKNARSGGGGGRPAEKRSEQKETAGASASTAAASAAVSVPTFAISNAHRYASEYQRRQEEEHQRCERAQRQKAREQALREQRERRPEVFMAAAVRAAVRTFLFNALRRAALMGPAPPAASGCTDGEYELYAGPRSGRNSVASSYLGAAVDRNCAALHVDSTNVRPLEWSCVHWLTNALLLFPQISAGDPSLPHVSTEASTAPDSRESRVHFRSREEQSAGDARGEHAVRRAKRQPGEQKTRGKVETWLLQMLQKREGFSANQAEASVSALLHVLHLFTRNRTIARAAAQQKQRSNPKNDNSRAGVAVSSRAAAHRYGSSSDVCDSSECHSSRTRGYTASTWEDWEAGDCSGHETEDCVADAVALAGSSAQCTCQAMDHSGDILRRPAEKQELLRSVLQSCIDWICLNEDDESKLPDAYSPLGKQIEVHVFGKSQSTASPAEPENDQEEELQADELPEGAAEQGQQTAAGAGRACQSAQGGLLPESLLSTMRTSSGARVAPSPEASKQWSVDRLQLQGTFLTPVAQETASEVPRGGGTQVCAPSQRESHQSSISPNVTSASGASSESQRSGATSRICQRHQTQRIDGIGMREASGDAVADALTCAGKLLVGHRMHIEAPACYNEPALAACSADNRRSGVLRSELEKSAAVTDPTTWQEAISSAASHFSSVLAASRSPPAAVRSDRAPTRHFEGTRDIHTEAALEALRSCSMATWMYSRGLELLEGGISRDWLASVLLQQAQKALLDEEGGSPPADKEKQHRRERKKTQVACAGDADQHQDQQQHGRIAAEEKECHARCGKSAGRDARLKRETFESNREDASSRALIGNGLSPAQSEDVLEGDTKPNLTATALAARLEELLRTEQQVVESTMPAASFVLLPPPAGGVQEQQPPHQQPQQQPHPLHRCDSGFSTISGVFGHARLDAVDVAPLLSFFSLHCSPPSTQQTPAAHQQPQPLCVPLHVFLYAPAGSLFPLSPPIVWVSFDLPPQVAQLQQSQRHEQSQVQQQQQRRPGGDSSSGWTDSYTFCDATLAFLSLCVSLTVAHVLASRIEKQGDLCAVTRSQGGSQVEDGHSASQANPVVASGGSCLPVRSHFVRSLRGLSALLEHLEATGLGTSTFSEVVALLQSPLQLLASLSAVFSRYLAPSRSASPTAVAPSGVAAVSATAPPAGNDTLHTVPVTDFHAVVSRSKERNGNEQPNMASVDVLPASRVQQRLRTRLQQNGKEGRRSANFSGDHWTAPAGIAPGGRIELIRRWRTLLGLPSAAGAEDEWRDTQPTFQAEVKTLCADGQQQLLPSQDRHERRKQLLGQLQQGRTYKEGYPHCELAGRAPDTAVPPLRRSYTLTLEICEKILQSREASSSAEGPRLPVREYEGALQAFMCEKENKHQQVLVLQGETGSGKTTQVPRILLEAAAREARKQLLGVTETQCFSPQPQRQRQRQQPLAYEQQQLSAVRPTEEAGKECFIICSQPRRLAAMSVAVRVSAEMNTAVGDVVGYHVRLKAAASSNTRLLFCTHGILLRRLLADRTLSDVSVVCLDEVHERTVEVDLLLLILSKTLAANPRIKIVLMSATISAETFAAYFHPAAVHARCSAALPGQNLSRQPAVSSAEDTAAGTREEQQSWQRREQDVVMPVALSSRGNTAVPAARRSRCGSGAVATLRVPGRTFPVKIFYAEDLQKMVDFSFLMKTKSSNAAATGPHAAACSAPSGSDQGGRRNALEQQRADNFSGAAADDTWVAAAELSNNLGPASLMCGSRQMPRAVAELVKYIHMKNLQHRTGGHHGALRSQDSAADPEATGAAAEQLWSETGRNTRVSACVAEGKPDAGGAILVFSTGVGEVAAACRAIEELGLPLWVLPCHASLHIKQQQRVFSRAPPGMRKVVVATNIAETSVTIPDVSYVIDTGLHKQMNYEVSKRLNQLQEEVISRSSAQQRAGRAGRVGPGECYRLYCKDVFEKLMIQTEKPELHRQPLENVCLQLKAIFPEDKLSLLLAQCIEPPSVDSVSTAVRRLCRVGALRVDTLGKEHLTSFGSVLSLFPMDLLMARMLLYSAVLSCLDEVLALCALMAVESVLYQSHSANPAATEARLKCFSRSQSDFITNLRVFLAWRRQSTCRAEDTFCTTFGVNSQTMRNAEELRKRFSRVVDEVSLRLLQKQEQKRTVGDRLTAPASRRATQSSPSNKKLCDEVTPRLEEEEDERIAHSAVLCEGDLAGAQSEVKEAQDGGLRGRSQQEQFITVEDGKSLCSGGGLKYTNQTDSQGNLNRSKGDTGEAEADIRACSKFWHIKACVAAGLYPQVALVQTPKKRFMQVASGTVEKVAEAREVKFMAYLDDEDRRDDSFRHGSCGSTASRLQRVFIHPSSVIFKSGAFETQWVAYMEKVQTTKPFIKEVSTVSVFALLLLSRCGLRVEGGSGTLYLDDWIQLRCPGLIGTYLKNLKALFYLLLEVYMQETVDRIREKACTLPQWNAGVCPPVHHIDDSKRFFGEFGQESIFTGEEGIALKNALVDLVKRLVEFEGHRL